MTCVGFRAVCWICKVCRGVGVGISSFLFSVKIVIAEGLIPLDSSPSSKLDRVITLSNEESVKHSCKS